MKTDLNKIADILDEDIEKGERIEARQRFSKSSKIERFEDDIVKSLTHNPFEPFTMTEESSFYNPYAAHPMGGFYPHSNDSWAATGRHQEDHGTRDFYRVAGDEPMDKWMREPMIAQQSRSQFAKFSKSIDDYVIKGGPVPVGTVHTYTDGQRYKKLAEGKWAPLAGLESKKTQKWMQHKDPKVAAQAHQGIEQHAGQKTKIESLIKERQKADELVGRAKNEAVQAAAEHTKRMMGGVFDGPMPKHLEEEHEKTLDAHGRKKEDPKGMLEQASEGLKPKTHHVEVNFKHNGQEYSHRFENVHGGTHQEAIERVQETLKQKLPGHQLTKIHAETVKDESKGKQKKEAPKQSPSGDANV